MHLFTWQAVAAMTALSPFFLVTVFKKAVLGNLLNFGTAKKPGFWRFSTVMAGFATVCIMQFTASPCPKTSRNKNYVDRTFQVRNRNLRSSKILYLNDKYIFERVATTPLSDQIFIKILRFEKFISYQDCKGSGAVNPEEAPRGI